jgi:predicted small lipoprotein YifL
MRRLVRPAALLALGTLSACGQKRVYVPPPPPSEPCPQIGQANPQTEVPKLRAMFRELHKDLIVSGDQVYVIPCSDFKIQGGAETSGLAAAGEQSKVIARSESSSVLTADEASKLAAANEQSAALAANEASHIKQAAEASQQRAAASIAECIRLAPGTYRLVSRVDPASLKVFDGVAFFSVGPDGMVQ